MSNIVEQPDLSVDHTPPANAVVLINLAVEILPGHDYVIHIDRWDGSQMTPEVFADFEKKLKEHFPQSKFVVFGRGETVEDVLDVVLKAHASQSAEPADS